ncbi:MAG: CDP-diacylglycerol--serine O-phosphatidyltransferase [Treponema sp.]|jgi:CDP-diacylglycerol--serine O-phosphatidyltransferase|nr:CDP-diacylglycerol--serine O-phosphatidyltransferase [Treponema sp.]
MRVDLKKGIYILPSLFTCANMTFGILSIMFSVDGQFIHAAWALVFSLVCDILDGRIARLTHTTTSFGLELDSLSDLVSFGIAPSIMIYQLELKNMGKPGIAIAVLFILCSALRLARFNVMAHNRVSPENFMGLPTPASAGVLVSFVLSYELLGPEDYALNSRTIDILQRQMPVFFRAMPVVMVILSFLEVSNVPYYSFKHIKFSRFTTIRLLVVAVVLILLVAVYPQNVFFIIFTVYALSGILTLVLKGPRCMFRYHIFRRHMFRHQVFRHHTPQETH